MKHDIDCPRPCVFLSLFCRQALTVRSAMVPAASTFVPTTSFLACVKDTSSDTSNFVNCFGLSEAILASEETGIRESHESHESHETHEIKNLNLMILIETHGFLIPKSRKLLFSFT